MFRAILTALWLLTRVELQSSAAAGDGMDAQHWKPLCQLSEGLEQAPNKAVHKLEETASVWAAGAQTAINLAVYAAVIEDTTEQERAAALAIYFRKKADKAASASRTTLPSAVITAATRAAYQKGRLDETISLLAQSKESTNGCLQAAAGSTGATVVAKATIDGEACKLTAPTPAASDKPLAKFTPGSGFDQDIMPTTPGNKASSTKECALLKVNAAGFTKSNTPEADVWYAGQLFKAAIGNANIAGNKLTIDGSRDPTRDNPWQTLAHDLTALHQLTATQYTNASSQTEPDTDLLSAVQELNGIKEDADGTKAKAVLTRLFDKDPTTKIKELIGRAENHNVQAAGAPATGKEMIKDLPDAAKATAILVAQVIKLKKQLAKTKETSSEAGKCKDATSPSSKCSTHDSRPKCEEETTCSWHTEVKYGEKNCQYNETKAKANGVPVTQTQTVGGTETTTDKCKDKKKDECKSPDCKWEGETCKDSSFLVNKKLAKMASAFFSLVTF
uniref:Variant surface glycoprotein 468 n=1 Tax=Trypanosoma brucei TaxID=5691 RepID=M4SY57_9TRYP|nr:variant surface glycoprotein 468 [Trypanosoma brucei]